MRIDELIRSLLAAIYVSHSLPVRPPISIKRRSNLITKRTTTIRLSNETLSQLAATVGTSRMSCVKTRKVVEDDGGEETGGRPVRSVERGRSSEGT
jgi:hypothetical protein